MLEMCFACIISCALNVKKRATDLDVDERRMLVDARMGSEFKHKANERKQAVTNRLIDAYCSACSSLERDLQSFHVDALKLAVDSREVNINRQDRSSRVTPIAIAVVQAGSFLSSICEIA